MSQSLLELSSEEGPRRVALSYLDAAAAAAKRLADSEDQDSLHDFRVSVRRLRSCLRAYDAVLGSSVSKKVRARIKKLASSTNPGRDAEVQLEWVREMAPFEEPSLSPGARWIEARLADRKDEAYAAVRGGLKQRFDQIAGALRKGLSTYTVRFKVGKKSPLTDFGVVAADVLEAQLDALVEGLRRVESIEDEELAHQARIYGKRLRYQLEPLRRDLEGGKELVKELKALQDLLGDLNDLSNLVTTLGQALEDTALDQARRLRDAATDGYQDIAKELEHDERPGLMALLHRVQQDRVRHFDDLLNGWLAEGGRLDVLEREVREATATLRRGASMPGSDSEDRDSESFEIERKYLLTALPPATTGHAPVQLEQGYLPGDRLIERVRKLSSPEGARYVRTVKLGQGVKRIEVEEACEPSVFNTLWSLTEGRRVTKQRYEVTAGDRVWEIDQFTDRDLVLAEIELPSEDEAVVIPEWLEPYVVREVTDEATYVNANLAR